VAAGMMTMEFIKSDSTSSGQAQLFYIAMLLLGISVLLFLTRVLRGSVLKFRRSKLFLKMEVQHIYLLGSHIPPLKNTTFVCKARREKKEKKAREEVGLWLETSSYSSDDGEDAKFLGI